MNEIDASPSLTDLRRGHLPERTGGTRAGDRPPGVQADRQQSGTTLFQHLPATTDHAVTGGVFSAGKPAGKPAAGPTGAAPNPLVPRPEDLLGLPPKQILRWAQHCMAMLQRPAGTVKQAEWLDCLGDCIARLGCDRLPLTAKWTLIQDLQRAGKDPHYPARLAHFLAGLAATLQQLQQLHPSLSAPDTRTPAELGTLVLRYTDRCAKVLPDGHVLLALEYLDAIREACVQLDPGRTRYPELFEALRQLADAVRADPLQADMGAVRRVVRDSGMLRQTGSAPSAPTDLDDLDDLDGPDASDEPDDLETDESQDPAALQDCAGTAASTASGTSGAPPREWPDGSPIPVVKAFLDTWMADNPGSSHSARVFQVMEQFGLPHKSALCLTAAVDDARHVAALVHALCWNVKRPVPLPVITSTSKLAEALNVLADYQRRKQADGWPIVAPGYDDLLACSKEVKLYVKIWGSIFWEDVKIAKPVIRHAPNISNVLRRLGAYEDRGVYIRVSDLLKDDALKDNDRDKILGALNYNSQLYKSEFGETYISKRSRVTLRQNVPVHVDVEDDMLRIIEQFPPGTVFNNESFRHLNHTGTYVFNRLRGLCGRRKLTSVEGEKGYFRLAPKVAGAAGGHQAGHSRRKTSQGLASSTRFSTMDAQPPVPAKRSRVDS